MDREKREMIDCPECTGTGGTDAEEKCERCRGTGQVLGIPPSQLIEDERKPWEN